MLKENFNKGKAHIIKKHREPRLDPNVQTGLLVWVAWFPTCRPMLPEGTQGTARAASMALSALHALLWLGLGISVSAREVKVVHCDLRTGHLSDDRFGLCAWGVSSPQTRARQPGPGLLVPPSHSALCRQWGRLLPEPHGQTPPSPRLPVPVTENLASLKRKGEKKIL